MLYHHFPGGKVELAIVAIQIAVESIVTRLEQLRTTGDPPDQILAVWLEHAQKRLAGSDFEKGCPLAAVALESTAQDHKLRKALDEGFKIQAYKNAPIVERIDIDPRNGWESIGHIGYFRTQAQPLWDRSVQWFRQLIISA